MAAARRLVSLVPSLTESVASVDASALVGATDWCTHPADLDVRRVRGTKNPDVAAVVALAPDVVLCNREENRKLDVERLRASGIRVWVSRIDTLDDAFRELGTMFDDVLGWTRPGWLADAERLWSKPRPRRGTVACPIWRDPWMVVGGDTFIGDVLGRLGFRNLFADRPRYPHVSLDEIRAPGPDLVVLPDEPYAFGRADAEECFPDIPTALVEGRLLTWYGPSLLTPPRL